MWKVIASPDLLITFTFGTLSLEHHDDCRKDYLEVNNCIEIELLMIGLELRELWWIMLLNYHKL